MLDVRREDREWGTLMWEILLALWALVAIAELNQARKDCDF